MAADKTGGPAFPRALPTGKMVAQHAGMTLRDYFAAKAMAATYMNGFAGPQPQERARVAYEMADAMLKEKDRTDGR